MPSEILLYGTRFDFHISQKKEVMKKLIHKKNEVLILSLFNFRKSDLNSMLKKSVRRIKNKRRYLQWES